MEKTIFVREASTSMVKLQPEDARWLQETGVANVLLGREKDEFKIQVGNVAGLISNGSLTVEIEPKLNVGELMWLLTYAACGVRLRDEEVDAAPTSCAEGLARILVKLVGDVLAAGLPRGYRKVEETGPTLRGRLRFADQLAKHHGRLHPLEQSLDEIGANIAENQIMRAACTRSLKSLVAAGHPATGDVQAALRRIIRNFVDVDELAPGAPLPKWRRTAQNQRAWHAVELAELMLQGRGVDVLGGDRRSLGLVIDMPKVFEASVARGLGQVKTDWNVRAQNVISLSRDGRHVIRPDIVIESSGNVVSVADTKYKHGAVSISDIYQMFTYANLFRVHRSHLIYAVTSSREAPIHIGETGVSVISHGLDLARPSQEFLPQLRELAETLV